MEPFSTNSGTRFNEKKKHFHLSNGGIILTVDSCSSNKKRFRFLREHVCAPLQINPYCFSDQICADTLAQYKMNSQTINKQNCACMRK